MLKIFSAVLFSSFAISVAAQEINFTTPESYPEGVAYNQRDGMFYVSGVYNASVARLSPGGAYTIILQDSTLKSTYGMKVDPSTNKLWVCAGDPNYSKYKSEGTYRRMIRVIAIDLNTGRKTDDIDLTNITPGDHFANDIVFDGRSNAYITDSYSPNIYKIDANGNASLFVTHPLLYGGEIGLNGIAYHPQGYLITANSGTGSLLKVNVNNPADISTVSIDRFFPGADGLWLHDANTISLVQNQGTNKVFRIATTDNWASAKVTGMTPSSLLLGQPSTTAMMNGQLWVLNSKLNELADSSMGRSMKFKLSKVNFESL